MYIVLDSNIFFNNWHLNGAEFARLIEHANRVAATVLIPQVVVEEVNAKYSQQLTEVDAQLSSVIAKAERLLSRQIACPSIEINEPYDLLERLKSAFYSVGVARYEAIGHERLVKKAIHDERPFRSGEKGYRDTLIWLSILDFLDSNRSDRHVAFITQNKNDFFAPNKEGAPELHDQLKADWEAKNLENRLLLYSNLAQFNQTQPFPVDQSIDVDDFSEQHVALIEEALSGAVRDFMEGPGTLELLRRLCLPGLAVRESHCDIVEGFEDTEVLEVLPLSASLSYVHCRFNLRAVYFSLEVPVDAYNAHKRDVDLTFQMVTVGREYVQLDIGVRCYLTASVLVDSKQRDVSEIDFQVEGFAP